MAEVLDSLEGLLARATIRRPLNHSDSKSGARLEEVEIGDERFVVKYLDLAADWTLRGLGDLGCTTLLLWERGVLDRLPDCIDQPIVAVARDPAAACGSRGTALLMRDVSDALVPAGDDPLPLARHLAFVDHMAAMHATFWGEGAGTAIDLIPAANRYLELTPWLPAAELAALPGEPRTLEHVPLIPRLVAQGWPMFAELAPAAYEVVGPLILDPSPLVDALSGAPMTLVHGNWKLGNLGSDRDGRTVLIDWESPGRWTGCSDLAYYVAINAARLPHAKEDAVEAYRDALERHGVDTGGWFDTTMRLSLLGALVQFGWEKALSGHNEELMWWERRAVEAAPLLPGGS